MNIKKNTSVRINLLNLLYQSVLLTIRLLGHNNIYVSKDKPYLKQRTLVDYRNTLRNAQKTDHFGLP